MIVLVTVGISASLLAYAVSPGVRHAVGHAAHSVKHAVGRVFDHDSTPAGARRGKPAKRVVVRRDGRRGGVAGAPAKTGRRAAAGVGPGTGPSG